MSAGFYFLLTLSDFYFLIALNWFALLSLHLIFFYIILDWIYVEYVRRFQISRIKMINTIIALSCSFFLPLSWDNKRYIPVHVSMHVNLISQIQEPVHAVLFLYIILSAVAWTLGVHLVGETEAGWGLQSPPSSDRAPRGCMHHHPTVRHSAWFPQWILCSCHFTGEGLWFYYNHYVLVAGNWQVNYFMDGLFLYNLMLFRSKC